MSLLNNNGILKNSAFKQPFTVKRRSGGAFDAESGKWVDGADLPDVTASGSIQPVTERGMELLRTSLEGGARITEAIRVYTSYVFSAGTNGATGTSGDLIVFRGLEWSVVRISPYGGHGHEKVYGVRIDGQNG